MSAGKEGLAGDHPIWEGAIVGFLGGVEMGLVSSERVIPSMGQVCMELLQGGYLSDLGTLQRYLREKNALVQLVAHPFSPEEMPDPRMKCIDMVTKEPRGHWMMVCAWDVDRTEVKKRLRALAMSDEVNEHALAHDTGILAM